MWDSSRFGPATSFSRIYCLVLHDRMLIMETESLIQGYGLSISKSLETPRNLAYAHA
ncbi:hypothetical protein PAAG_01328 [Paracoccidioides lutzii Pb01]|uniref:Uncharacterized protein n=1 Tax=Paracoccidioides lutzii (strain ATCC MYA-826 / Pb01) TaxID=502779 RepID=C1GS33_PARBA|nr:hypothetical protein PAAG_01328 [Paracoccidioides lutzii Pb01]EEH38866.2 hypothetical protein PAAG_01328 [Paracoccidioides lutzii Pb01]